MDGDDEVGHPRGEVIDVKLKPETEYTFDLTNTVVSSGCGDSTVYLGCGTEFKLIDYFPANESSMDYGNGWHGDGSFQVFDGAPIENPMPAGQSLRPSAFVVRLSNGEDDESLTNGGDGDGENDSSMAASEPTYEKEPSPSTTVNLKEASASLTIPLGKIGIGSGGTAPYRSAGVLFWTGQLSGGLASPSHLEYLGVSEVRALTGNQGVMFDEATPVVGGATEKHLVTPTRLFRITGFNGSDRDTAVNYATATRTYIREYVRASNAETMSTTLGRPVISWYVITPDTTTGLKLEKSVKGKQSYTSLKAPSSNELVTDDGLNQTEVVVGGLSESVFTRVKVSKRSGIIVSRNEVDYSMIDGKFKMTEERQYADPVLATGVLATQYNYYHSGLALPYGTLPGQLRWASYPDGSWKFYRYTADSEDIFTAFASETILDTDEESQTVLPIISVGGTAGRYQKLVVEPSKTATYVSSDLSGSSVNDFQIKPEGGGSSGGWAVENVTTDAVLPDSVGLVSRSGDINYSSGMDATSADRWLAGQPVLTTSDTGLAYFHEYTKMGGIITKTVTSGILNWEASGGKIVGSTRFLEVSGRSDRVISVYGPQGLLSKEQQYHTGSGFSSASLELRNYNADGSYSSTIVNGVVTHQIVNLDAYTMVETNSTGGTTTTVKNAQGETVSVTQSPGGGVPAQQTTYQIDGLKTTILQNGTVTSETIVDGIGRIVSSKNASGITTSYSYPDGGIATEKLSPGGITKRTENYLDGRTKSISGSGVVPEFYSYDVHPDDNMISSSHSLGSATDHTVRKTIQEFENSTGNRVKIITPSPAGGTVGTEYEWYGDHLFAETTTEHGSAPVMLSRRLHAPTFFFSLENLVGFEEFEGFDMDGDSELTFGSTDRFSKREWSYIVDDGKIFRRTLSHRYPDGTEANKLTTETRERLSFVPDGTGEYIDLQKVIEPSGRSVTTTTTVDVGSATIVTVHDDSATTGVDTTTTAVNGYVTKIQKAGFTKSETFQYDTLGRLVKASDSRGAASRTINNNFQVDKIIDHLGRETSYIYYPSNAANAGKIHKVIHPGGAETETIYNNLGQIQEIKGSAEYRQVFGYNEYGEKITLQTFGASPALTRWIYQPATGLLAGKRYNDEFGSGVGYNLLYTADGKISRRTSARDVVTDYNYDPATRDLIAIHYTGDGDYTPDINYSEFDNFGRPKKVVENDSPSNIQELTYQRYSSAVSTTYDASHDWLPSVSVVQSADDSLGRPTGFQTKVSDVTKANQAYQYDTLSRLQSVSSDDLLAEIGYLDGTGILRQQTIKETGGQVIHDRRLAIDMLGRTVGVENRVPGSGPGSPLITIASVGHSYDPSGRRERANREDGTVWQYSYNTLSEVVGVVKKTGTGTTVPGLGFGYAYDGIGNRVSATIGSPGHETELGYTPNALNQYETLTHSGKFWALVRSDAAVTATTSEGSIAGVTQVGNFYGAKVTVGNSAGGQGVDVEFSRSGVPVPGSVETWVPEDTFSPTYDLDGNLTNDGRWVYTWDGENRLVSMVPTSTAVSNNAPNVEMYFSYDFMNRRIGKTVVDKRVTPTVTRNISYAYDGWNPVAQWERTGATLTLKHTHLWGLDIASSGKVSYGPEWDFQQAGGVAGLIASTYHNSPSSREHFLPGYDANGNIISWTAEDGSLIRKIDYDAFGNEVMVENFGVVTKLPEFGFSTKIKDAETGLSYYGLRYYDPKTGRWPSRDPIEEQGGVNLYGFVGSNGVNKWDYVGLWGIATDCDEEQIKILKAAESASRKAFEAWHDFTSAVDDDYLTGTFPNLAGNNKSFKMAENFTAKLANNTKILMDAVDNGSVNVECECSCKFVDTVTFAETYAYTPAKTIHFCPRFFKEQSDLEQAATFAHEMSHAMLNTGHAGSDWTDTGTELIQSLGYGELYEDLPRFTNSVELRYKQYINGQ
ncbi:MAG: RHS repeat-associated core domain-containing protein [Verrucomicrobiota bacterium]